MHAEVWEVQIYENLFSAEAAKHYFEFLLGFLKLLRKQGKTNLGTKNLTVPC